jgi:hypothetical protein
LATGGAGLIGTRRIPEPRNFGNVTFRFDGGHDSVQMFGIAQFDIDPDPEEIRLAINELEIRDIGLALTNQCANSSQYAGVIANGQF